MLLLFWMPILLSNISSFYVTVTVKSYLFRFSLVVIECGLTPSAYTDPYSVGLLHHLLPSPRHQLHSTVMYSSCFLFVLGVRASAQAWQKDPCTEYRLASLVNELELC